jgi:photosystem II stability/assembly factor-like uncharacterized protein
MSRLFGYCWLAVYINAISLAYSGDSNLFSEMRWRLIGPFRAGRTVAISGVVQQPSVFYMAPNNGGVWKTTNYGRTWTPIFDGQDTGSIGSLAIAPSDPNVVYVGSGEGLQRPDLSVGDGIYKSTDAGRTWRHLGLRDGQQIPSVIVDPHDPNRLFVAVLGHPYGPNAERGVYRSTDGGESFQKVLGKDENTGAVQVSFDPADARSVYASLWCARQAPWEITDSFQGPGSGLFKSTDGGNTWKELRGGLPTIAQGLGRIGIGIAPSDSQRIYAMVDADQEHGGVYRTDDGGENWRRIANEKRLWERGNDFACVQVDPKNADRIYILNTSTYRSDDGGRSYLAIKGAPGGDDYHSLWINPNDPNILLLGVDQGATLSVDGGKTWSSWYNQPTAQFYHVITDNQFPYWVYGGQQESGSVAVASRSDDGSISSRCWHTVGVEEYGYVAPDPLHPELIYGGKATRFNSVTGDVQDVGPQVLRGKYRFVRTMPLLFSPADPRILYLGSNVLFKTTNGGDSWTTISPDLTREHWDMPSVITAFASKDPEGGKHRGVIYSIAPSPKDVDLIWVGTDDGLIHVTWDGSHWQNVTPPELTPWSKVSQLEASHFNPLVAYAAINRFRLDDLTPHILRTRDGGKTWDQITAGLPGNAVVNSVREDPKRKGLLYAGTEIGVFVSFNEGYRWQPLQMNLPVTSVRDLVVHEDDLVIGTHGRSFWILDDITPLRQIGRDGTASEERLFTPERAVRWRWNRGTETPLPPEEPAGENPPDGAIIDYILGPTTGRVVLEILDSAGKLVRQYSSEDKSPVTEEQLRKELNVPTYWVRPPQILSAEPGKHRFVWDMRYSPPKVLEHEYSIAAIYRNTPRGPLGAPVLPGRYTVRLKANGRTYTQPLVVVMDPRIKTTGVALRKQLTVLLSLSREMEQDYNALAEVRGARRQKTKLDHLESQEKAFETLNGSLRKVYGVIEGTDNGPTSQGVVAAASLQDQLKHQMLAWQELKKKEFGSTPVTPLSEKEMETSQSTDKDQDEP